MKRLVDESFAPGTSEDQLAQLVRASPRFEPEPFAKPRVLARVTLPHARRHGALPRSFASVIVLGGTAMAAAAAGNQLWTVHQRAESAREVSGELEECRKVTPSSIRATERPPAPTGLAGVGGVVTSASDPAVAPPTEPNERPLAMAAARPLAPANRGRPLANEVGRLTSTTPKRAAESDAKSTRQPERDGDDPAQVLEAIRSLRTSGNPVRAAGLLDDYLSQHPRGVLTEDALALAIEAADARRDHGSAADYAERYVRQYPIGRFRPLADAALGRRGR